MIPLYTVKTAYTLSQYREYNRTVQKYVWKAGRKLMIPPVVFLLTGILLWIAFDTWYAVPLFLVLGLTQPVLAVRRMRRAEILQYQQEQLVGTVTYEFYDERIDVFWNDGSVSNPYAECLTFESDTCFFVVFRNLSGIILPKEDCSAELKAFVRERMSPKRV